MALSERFLDRLRRLLQVQFTERRKILPSEISRIKEEMNFKHSLHSSATLKKIHKLCEEEVVLRAKSVWDNILRIHKTIGAGLSATLADDMKREIKRWIDNIVEEIDDQMKRGLNFMSRDAQRLNLDAAKRNTINELDVEVDLYIDSLNQDTIEKKTEEIAQAEKTSDGNVIFISHAAEDAVLAETVKNQIDNVFDKKINVFVSSIPGTIKPGSDWFDKILCNLTDNNAFVVLVTPYSEKRPFVWFEIGFSWFRKLNKDCEIYAICAPPIEPGNLSEPLCRLQAISLGEGKQTEAFFNELINQFKLGNLDALNFAQIKDSLPTYSLPSVESAESVQQDDLQFNQRFGIFTSKETGFSYCTHCYRSFPSEKVELQVQDNGWRCHACGKFYRNPNYNPPRSVDNDYLRI